MSELAGATLAASGTTSSWIWYISRSTALVTFLLLTTGVVLGLIATRRQAGVPRFVSQRLHRNIILLALSFLVVHVVTVVIDTYVSIDWYAAVVPFTSGYRPYWVAAGTTAFDLIVLLVTTSLLRVRFGWRLWRTLHWLAYLLWPLALTHYLGAGTDSGTLWGRLVAIAAAAAVAVALVSRIAGAIGSAGQDPGRFPTRGTAVGRAPQRRPAPPRAPAGAVHTAARGTAPRHLAPRQGTVR
jgi:sulfoxide reductase heme-binding subunit YedZ